MGMRGIVQTRVDFQSVQVEPHYLLGDAGMGLQVAEMSFHLARYGLAIASCGAAKRCAQLLLRYATRRKISTGPLAKNPAFRHSFLRIIASIEVLELLAKLVAEQLDSGSVVPELFFVCKALGPEYLGFAADSLVQFLGGRGYIEANEAPQLLRDARLLRIFEGPTETMLSHLGSRWAAATSLRDLLRSSKAGGPILKRIETACEKIAALPRLPGSDIGQYIHARNLAQGRVLADGIAWWLLAIHGSTTATEWAQIVFEDTCTRMLRDASSALPLDVERIQNQLACSIGDVVQTLPGEDWSMDPLLL